LVGWLLVSSCLVFACGLAHAEAVPTPPAAVAPGAGVSVTSASDISSNLSAEDIVIGFAVCLGCFGVGFGLGEKLKVVRRIIDAAR